MSHRRQNPLKIAPPDSLNPEHLRIWIGWNELGDKEVAREAAAKGLYIKLAIEFLAARKQFDSSDAEKWFKTEVFLWITELLERRQIYKASHILSNVGVDAILKLCEFFAETLDINLRNYLGEYLIKNDNLPEVLSNSWILLELIESDPAISTQFLAKYGQLTVAKIVKMPSDLKCRLAVQFFFTKFDFRLERFLKAEMLWEFLLKSQKFNYVKYWIEIYFSGTVSENYSINFEMEDRIGNLFKRFEITTAMADMLLDKKLQINETIRENILNDLGKNGLFTEKERSNLTSILRRLRNTGNISKYREIFSSKFNSIDFIGILVDFCINFDIPNVINVVLSNLNESEIAINKQGINAVDFILKTRNTTLNNSKALKNNLLQVSQFLNTNLDEYFKKNPLILFAILILEENMEFFEENAVLIESFQFLQKLKAKKENKIPKTSLALCDLLQTHTDIKFLDLWKFVTNGNRVTNFSEPNFAVKNKPLDYKYFVRQCRPSVACKYFALESLKRSEAKVTETIHKIGSENTSQIDKAASCVAFLEATGRDSTKRRVYLDATKVLHESIRFEEPEEVIEFLKNEETTKISQVLESVVMENLNNQLHTKSSLVPVLKEYEIIHKFNEVHDLLRPNLLLKSYATNNCWLPFLLHIQLKNYTTAQSQDLVQMFKNPNLLEHINHSLTYNIDENGRPANQDPKSYFLAQSEECRQREAVESVSSSVSSTSSYGSMESGFSDASDCEVLNMKATLLQTIIRCHNSVDPPKTLLQACQVYRNPLLAILATSYEPDSVVTNWLIWLTVSCEFCEVSANYSSISFNPQSVADILKKVVRAGYLRTLQESFHIFLQDSPLQVILNFANECRLYNFETNSLIALLSSFDKKLTFIRSNSVIMKMDQEMTYLRNKLWLQNVATLVLANVLEYKLGSKFDKMRFLEVLTQTESGSVFNRCLFILKIMEQGKCDVKFDLSTICNRKGYEEATTTFITNLIEKAHFEEALQIAELENLPIEDILTSQFQTIQKENYLQSCKEADEIFNKYKVTSSYATQFFRTLSESTDNQLEKFEILKYIKKWAEHSNPSDLYEIEAQMWLLHLNKTDCKINFEPDVHVLYWEMLLDLENVPQNSGKIKLVKLNRAINELLNRGCFWQALKLEKMFGQGNENLEILKVCSAIAEGILSPYQLNVEQRLMLSGHPNRIYGNSKRSVLSRMPSFSSGLHLTQSQHSLNQSVSQIDQIVYDSLVTIESLTERLKAGVDIGQKILMKYRLSSNIGIPYHLISEIDDSMKMLKDALSDDCRNKIEVFHDFIFIYEWSKNKVADFVCEELVNSLSNYIRSNLMNLIMWDLNLNTEFHLILQIIKESSSLLGSKLYTYSVALHKAHTSSFTDFKISELALIVELIIRSHDCFTFDCNMEGISLILKKCQTLISVLLSLKSWKLIVRLLTGIARYTEMNYVFEILQENDQFEYLLSKGSKKDNYLKIALLDYLRKFCPENKELYRIVALHFNLFSEVAQLWEMEADNVISNLIAISKLEMQNNKVNPENEPFVLFANTDGTKMALNKAMVNYTHAAEYHLQGEKLTKAMNAAKQAELIAMQISMFKNLPQNSTTFCFLHLNQRQISTLVISTLSLSQTLILTQAYNYNIDWATMLFERYILNNELDYLENFTRRLCLSNNLVHDISRKFLKVNCTTETIMKNMKVIVNMTKSVHLKYKLASELGFMDIIEELLEGNQLAYLKDTVWKKGYRN